MAPAPLFSIFEHHVPPKLAALCAHFELQEFALSSMRKALAQLKKTPPAVVLAEFKYGYSNNYSGVHISNLDVFLVSLKQFAPQARVIVVADKDERPHVEKLNAILPLHGVLTFPLREQALETLLAAPKSS